MPRCGEIGPSLGGLVLAAGKKTRTSGRWDPRIELIGHPLHGPRVAGGSCSSRIHPTDPAAIARAGTGISRFPCKKCRCVIEFYDSAGCACLANHGMHAVAFRHNRRRRHPGAWRISQLNSPARTSPVNAWHATSRCHTHDSGPEWPLILLCKTLSFSTSCRQYRRTG